MLAEDLETGIAFLLYDTARQLRARFDERARGIGVTRQQWRVLMILARQDGRNQSEVADMLDVERITLCRMIDRLAEAGLVERRADPRDRRMWRLHLLPAAHEIVAQLSVVGRTVEAEARALLGADAALLHDGLLRLHDGLRDDARRSAA
ncbi:MarR family winged helix-turn-helix transcriptional regulator [Sphingomonas solaris]|uniref:MarR family transcriptional regulator n=1 Tax=Alterirhizorhabdus solaris TaxID=2529389 RepID=A0A558QV95_9SPHN|nr:MarR family transcriptional regulator [Sphingomonas solaris]TVV71066.1 MarR family transcriptional regulator [Sphingomonas solaris]